MTRRSFDPDTERRAPSVRVSEERDPDSSVRSSPVAILHRRVGNQAVQENYTPGELRNPLGLGGSSDRADGTSDDRETSGDDEQSTAEGTAGGTGTSDTQESSGDDGTSEDRKTSGEKSRRHGPNRTGKFVVEFDDDKVPGWKSVTIPAMSVEQGSYREGNEAPERKEVAVQPSEGDAEMERVAVGLWDWAQAVLNGDERSNELTVTVDDEESDSTEDTDE